MWLGQLGDGTETTRNSPVFVNRASMGYREIIVASAGEDFSLVVTRDGLAYGFGRNDYGILKNNYLWVNRTIRGWYYNT